MIIVYLAPTHTINDSSYGPGTIFAIINCALNFILVYSDVIFLCIKALILQPAGTSEPPLEELTSLQPNVSVSSDSTCTPSELLCRPLEFDRVGLPLPTSVAARRELLDDRSRARRCFPCDPTVHSTQNALHPPNVWIGKSLVGGPAAERANITIDLTQVLVFPEYCNMR